MATIATKNSLEKMLQIKTLFTIGILTLFSCTPTPITAPENQKPASLQESASFPTENLALIGGNILLSDGSFGVRNIHIVDQKIHSIDQRPATPQEHAIDISGNTLLPTFIDSHVHITFSEPHLELEGGIGAAIDFGAPPTIWSQISAMLPFRVYPAGQLITAKGGYPTQSWGKEGYGLEVEGIEEARQAVEKMIQNGAKVIKMPLEPRGPLLTAEEQKIIVKTAHDKGVLVGTHALTKEMLKMALDANVDLLVHAPTELLPTTLIESFCTRKNAAVITTFYAFGASKDAVLNVKNMREAGCIILYGTDLGNNIPPGIQSNELQLYVDSLEMTPQEAIETATSVPATYFGLEDLGTLAPGKSASILVVKGNPYENLTQLNILEKIFFDGKEFALPAQ